jgi:hypothetical protein
MAVINVTVYLYDEIAGLVREKQVLIAERLYFQVIKPEPM